MPDFVTRSALGFGGPVQLHAARDGRNRPVWETTQSAAVFDTNKWFSGQLDYGFVGTKPLWGEVMLHEFGHAFGLDHSNGADEIMYFQAGNGVYPDGYFRGLYGAGDLTGLAIDGLGQGCFRQSGGSGAARERGSWLPSRCRKAGHQPPVTSHRSRDWAPPAQSRLWSTTVHSSRLRRSCSSSQSLALPKKPATSWTSFPSASCVVLNASV